MDPRSAGHVLSQIADFLELKGENRFKSAASNRYGKRELP